MTVIDDFFQQQALTGEDIAKARLYQEKHGGRVELILNRMGALSSEKLIEFYHQVFGTAPVTKQSLQAILVNDKLKEQIWAEYNAQLLFELAQKNILLCKQHDDAPITLISSPQLDFCEIEAVVEKTGLTSYQLLVATDEQFKQLSEVLLPPVEDSGTVNLSILEEDRLRELASEAPTVNLLNNLIIKALRRRASDMHIEPIRGVARVRYRIDGVLHDVETIPQNMVLPIVTRLKLLSKMDIAEKRRPQDGKIEMKIDAKSVDIRVSALPVGDGESIVMRFLLKESLSYDIKNLGIETDVEQSLLADIQATSGVILLTGPTGSGKTTSLYSFLSLRNEEDVKIITIEDPVEYQLSGINQVQVQTDIGYTFASALRSVVRQDPDIIMVGEIRDHETAAIALQSALTGHLVFSTLHTNDAPSAYTRLLDLGVEPFLLSAAVKVVVAQRLVRRLCPVCAQPNPSLLQQVQVLDKHHILSQHYEHANCKVAAGCEHCNHTGYSGRVAIIQYLKCDNELTSLLGHADFLDAAATLNRQRGLRSLLEDGLLKVLKGETTLDEVLRVAG
ncbi:type II secretion protein [Alishewanella longhuensis]|uniref:Type II secretion protein n=1 Tax=Alishewanella longhuensis TaxID=1091037 RepID=A0ABQ3KXG6_9ALTE|nr:GspE/PulE family protein [Alishewanella longhuensis]GHG68125.1 type II secretion protein [Alishewanella longhuensis]